MESVFVQEVRTRSFFLTDHGLMDRMKIKNITEVFQKDYTTIKHDIKKTDTKPFRPLAKDENVG